MINVLWLPSWYPSIESVQNGDFIERQAFAASKYANVSIIYVQSSSRVKIATVKKVVVNPNFHQTILLFPIKRYFRIINFVRYLYFNNRLFKNLYSNGQLPHIVHIHVSFKAGLIGLWLKYRYKLPYIITEHWSYFNKENEKNFSKSNFFKKFVFRLIFNNSDGVIPVSSNLDKQLNIFFPGINSSVVPNIVDGNLFYFSRQLIPGPVFRFIHVSSMIPLKKTAVIARVFSRLKVKYAFINLELVGPISKALIAELELKDNINDSIHFKGLLSHKLVADEMRNAHAFILFSQYENLPCVISESLCCGVPVISSAVGGVPEMLNESNGILIPPGDEEALYQAMESMILNYDQYDREKISADAQAKYNPDVIGQQIVDIYERILSQRIRQ